MVQPDIQRYDESAFRSPLQERRGHREIPANELYADIVAELPYNVQKLVIEYMLNIDPDRMSKEERERKTLKEWVENKRILRYREVIEDPEALKQVLFLFDNGRTLQTIVEFLAEKVKEREGTSEK